MEPEKSKCPGCDLELPTDDAEGQIAHMQARHPEIIEERMTRAGFMREPRTGQWIDTLAENA
jgi:hypothetical protein